YEQWFHHWWRTTPRRRFQPDMTNSLARAGCSKARQRTRGPLRRSQPFRAEAVQRRLCSRTLSLDQRERSCFGSDPLDDRLEILGEKCLQEHCCHTMLAVENDRGRDHGSREVRAESDERAHRWIP